MNCVFETRFAKVGETSTHYKTDKIGGSDDACKWSLNCLGGYFAERLDQEEFLVVTLDTKNVVRRVVRITRGTLDSSLVHPREVFRAAITDAAASILLIHNHPSGDPAPSPQDRSVTERLIATGEVVGITVLDHIVVGESRAVSIREESPELWK